MALTYAYPDAYLVPFCTEERETRALAEVGLMAGDRVFSSDYTEKLTILQTYIIACVENQAAIDDLFDVKLNVYRKELDIQLARAKEDADETANEVGTGLYSFPVVRL